MNPIDNQDDKDIPQLQTAADLAEPIEQERSEVEAQENADLDNNNQQPADVAPVVEPDTQEQTEEAL